MMKYSLLTLLFGFSFLAAAQSVDYDDIAQKISNQNSEFYYPTLLEKFNQGDESLTTDEYRALYYGFTFQETYRPYDREPLDQEISDLIAAGMNEETLPQLVEKSKEYLAKQPFSLKMNHYLQNFLNSEEDATQITLLQRQYEGIIQAILSSGDGKNVDTGYSVNNPSDEYMVLRYLNLTPAEHQFETTSDYFSVEENEEQIKGIYFDVYQMARVGTAQLGIETADVQDDEIPENGVEIGSADEIIGFVPTGYEIAQQISDDFDADGDLDWILVLTKQGEAQLSNYAANDPEKRLLVYIERAADKTLSEKFTNENIVPCIDCGGDEDPFTSLIYDDGVLRLTTTGGGLYVWERVSTFAVANGDFYLIEEAFTSYRKGKKDQAQTDVETEKEFGKVLLQEFDYYKLLE